MPTERVAIEQGSNNPGPYLAKIVSHLDPEYMGNLQVQLLHEVGNDERKEGQLHQVKYMSPFMGYTSSEFTTSEKDYNNSQKSYGMWMIPPDVGTIVMVIFVEGDPKKGYWIGCVHNPKDPGTNFMTPGYAATTYNLEDNKKRLPVSEFNQKATDMTPADLSKTKKAIHPFKEVLNRQGLLLDDIRGITTSSARREWPSAVFGISTPGPIDKRNGAKTGNYGKKEYEIRGGFVSRLGGSSFVMDDGDDKFLRVTSAGIGLPEYLSVENKETVRVGDVVKGDVTIPHNELIRLRTRTGHQILLHTSEDLIYICNARGTTWIELTSNGKIDIYAQDSISVHTKNDLNFYADRDINMECGRNFNTKVGGEMQTEVIENQNIIIKGDQFTRVKGKVNTTFDDDYLHTILGNFDIKTSGNNTITVDGNSEINSGGNNVITAGGDLDIKSGGDSKWTGGGTVSIGGDKLILNASTINLNGPPAPTAATAAKATKAELPKELKTHSVPNQSGTTLFKTIMRRVPTNEPWPHHENLDPAEFTPNSTDRDVDGRNKEQGKENSESILLVDKKQPEYWSGWSGEGRKYTAGLDTFAKIKKDE
jgi:hypothetical protein